MSRTTTDDRTSGTPFKLPVTGADSGGAIVEKTGPLDAIAFPTGAGTPRMLDSEGPYVHDVSASQQNVTAATGIALPVSNGRTGRDRNSFGPLGSSKPPPPPPDANFTLAASPSSRTIVRGASTGFSVTAAPLDGYAGSVTLSVRGLPPGVSAAFSRSPVSLATGAQASTMSVATTTSAMPGSYTLTVAGTDGTLTHSVPVTLQIKRT